MDKMNFNDFNLFPESVIIIDSNCIIVFMNKCAVDYYGEDMTGKKCFEVIHKLDVPCYRFGEYPCPVKILNENDLSHYSVLHKHNTNDSLDFVIINCVKDKKTGYIIEYHIQISHLIREMVEHGILNSRDLTENFYDKIKFFVGKEFFLQMLYKRLVKKDVRFLSIMDLKGVSFINKYYGMIAGDHIINSLENVIYKVLSSGKGNDLFTRAAGDEFIILHGFDDLKGVIDKERKIINGLKEQDMTLIDDNIEPKISVGTVELSKDKYYSIDEVLRLLSYAKGEAKKSEEYRFLIKAGTTQNTLIKGFKGENEIIDKVRKAISEKKIELFFQPVINISSNKIYDLEALVRIKEEDEFIEASIFIDMVYEMNLILQLDMLVFQALRKYCKKIKDISKRIFVNLSPHSMKSREFRKILHETISEIEKNGLEMTIELTEQLLLENVELIRFINEKYGIQFAIDDFGTGYSSFKMVADLSNHGIISTIKIDGSITRGIDSSIETLSIVKAITSMSKTLGLKIIAEYVNSPEILKILRNIGVDCGQGYYFSKPLSIDELKKEFP